MSSPTKRPVTDETRQNAEALDATHTSTPADLVDRLRSVGSRVRKNVTEGYNTQRAISVPSSPTKSPPQADIFISANDVLRGVYGSASAQTRPPVSPNKRIREDDSDHEFGGDIQADGAEKMDDSDGEKDMVLETRPVKPRPRRRLTQTQSLPINMFGHPQTASHLDHEKASVAQQNAESDWSTAASPSALPSFEPMVL